MTRMTKDHKYYPDTIEKKLGYLAEECGEVLAALGKTLRWGLESYNPDLPPHKRETNRAWLLREIADLKQALQFAEEELATRKPVADRATSEVAKEAPAPQPFAGIPQPPEGYEIAQPGEVKGPEWLWALDTGSYWHYCGSREFGLPVLEYEEEHGIIYARKRTAAESPATDGEQKPQPAVKSGDIVLHKPSGEEWAVAVVDGDKLIAEGWPCELTPIADCELLMACGKEESLLTLESWASAKGDDWRTIVARRQLAAIKAADGEGEAGA